MHYRHCDTFLKRYSIKCICTLKDSSSTTSYFFLLHHHSTLHLLTYTLYPHRFTRLIYLHSREYTIFSFHYNNNNNNTIQQQVTPLANSLAKLTTGNEIGAVKVLRIFSFSAAAAVVCLYFFNCDSFGLCNKEKNIYTYCTVQ